MVRLNEIGWWDEFRGRCVSCKHAVSTTRKKEMSCQLEKAARNRGLPSRPGGAWMGEPVHCLFGCVFFESAGPVKPVENVQADISKEQKL